MNIAEISENYKALPTHKLVRLARNLNGLPLVLIPVLQKELLQRGEQDEAMKLTEYLVAQQEGPKALSKEELTAEIHERLGAGESIESIALKFKENGIDVFEELNNDVKLEETTFDYMLSLKGQGVEDNLMKEKLTQQFSLNEIEVDVLKEKLKRKGRTNMVVGIAIVSAVVLLLILTGRLSIGGIIGFGLGVWRIVEGQRVLSKIK